MHIAIAKRRNEVRRIYLACGLSAVFVISACDQGGAKTGSHMECAALISAASHLSAQGKLEMGNKFQSQMLASMMTHVAAHAIPNGVSEEDAMAQVNERRVELIEAQSPSRILGRAETCIRKTPTQ